MVDFVRILRSGTFLTEERLRLWSIALLTAFVMALIYLGATAHGLNDAKGRPLGTDFSNVYAAGSLANRGEAAVPFDPQRQESEEKRIFGKDTQFYGWHYPPFFLLIAAPLARLPYISALVVWQAATLVLYLVTMAFLLRNGPLPSIAKNPLWILSALAFPAVFFNLTHGHNGFLTAALMAAALATLDREPIIAGIFFGLLAYKPQFGLLIPLVLATTARWRTFISAAITVGAIAAITTAIFGENIWPAFLASTHFTRVVVLEQGGTGFFKIQSVFACVRMWGGSVPLAYAAQGATTLAAAILLVRLWRSDAPFAYKGAALCLAALLATPYSLDYDLMVLGPAIALLGSEGLARGFRPYEVTALVALWAVPLVARSIAQATLIPLGVFAMLWVFATTIARLAPESSAAIVPAPERQSA